MLGCDVVDVISLVASVVLANGDPDLGLLSVEGFSGFDARHAERERGQRQRGDLPLGCLLGDGNVLRGEIQVGPALKHASASADVIAGGRHGSRSARRVADSAPAAGQGRRGC